MTSRPTTNTPTTNTTSTDLAYLEASPLAVIVVNGDGIIEHVNAKTEEIFGYLREDLIGDQLERLIPQQFRHVHHQHREGYFQMPRSRPMGLGLELMGLRKNGTVFPVEVGLSKVEVNGQIKAIGFISDISVRVQAAEALRQHAIELETRVTERTQEIDRRRRVAEGLHDILTILNTARPLDEILTHIAQRAHQLLGTDAVAIVQEEQDDAMAPIQVVGEEEQVETLDQDKWMANQPIGRTFDAGDAGASDANTSDADTSDTDTGGTNPDSPLHDERKIRVDENNSGQSLSIDSRSTPYRSVLAVPLNVKGEVYGTISLYYHAARSFTKEERELAVAFADQAALAIENSRLRDQVEKSAVAAERSRLARDLHDAVTQTLFSTSLIAEVLPRLWQKHPEMAQQKLYEMQELTRGALAEMRTLLMELRPSALIDAELPELLKQLAAAVTGRARVPVTVHAQGERVLPSDVRIAFYRIAQEALNNVSKHARATSAEVNLTITEQEARLAIVDDGRGFDVDSVPSSHLGLGIMRERAEAIGASINIDSTIGEGTQIKVSWI